MEPVMQLADHAAKLSSAMRHMSSALEGLKGSLQQVCTIERNLHQSRCSLTEAEASLAIARTQVAKCEADIKFESCVEQWDYISRKWVEVAAGYPMLTILSACPD